MGREKLLHIKINVLTKIINSKYMNQSVEFNLKHFIKFNKNIKHHKFMLKKINPTYASTIINKQYIIYKTMRGKFRGRIPDIRMY